MVKGRIVAALMVSALVGSAHAELQNVEVGGEIRIRVRHWNNVYVGTINGPRQIRIPDFFVPRRPIGMAWNSTAVPMMKTRIISTSTRDSNSERWAGNLILLRAGRYDYPPSLLLQPSHLNCAPFAFIRIIRGPHYLQRSSNRGLHRWTRMTAVFW